MNKLVRAGLVVVWMAVVLPGSLARAQGPWSRWYFGRQAGLYFGPDSVEHVPRSPLESSEACATISDSTGNLLFYSDGERVWNRLHQLVPRADTIGGHRSSTQGCVIVPAPRQRGRYLIYTLDGIEHLLANGLRLTEIEQTPDGRGRVVRKRVGINLTLPDTVYHPLSSYSQFTEKMALVRHANRQDYWLVTHLWQSETYVSVRVGQSLSDTATFVCTDAGMYHGGGAYGVNASGWLVASPDGRRLACAVGEAGTELLDFDPATGRVSNARRLNLPPVAAGLYAYGAAFSPDGNLLYLSYMSLTRPLSTLQYVVQYDVRLPAAQVGSSGIVVAAQENPLAALQLGNDGRIYVSVWTRTGLDRIEYPNVRGPLCLYRPQAWGLTPGSNGWLGLPLRPNDAPYATWLRAAADSVCAGEAATVRALNVPPLSTLDTLVWDFGDGTRARTTAATAQHSYPAPGRYQVRVQLRHVGLQAEATTWVTVRPAGACAPPQVLIPNVITPNGDARNDRFELRGLRAAEWRCRIFNRWGRPVFEVEAYQDDWRAAQQPAGVYYYHLTHRQDGRTIKGTVEVVR
ncbi:PKD domain-containing protein [Hymenobacter gummosus]|uniref:PKD domain-containing protein n=1 Tax=Hymenobacter gummosus TaxID=1776032 RepID=A0A3S0K7K2_9BACT|nr:gliding motility-associated C-terminal domain-containing protein [Hymenobacter gummosus]RTQ52243.1 PKD domain-containing protein [Hymenobacter gummosus]